MNYEELSNNKVTLMGEIASLPCFSHEVFGEGFYEFTLSVLRLSGQPDYLPITLSERLMENLNLDEGKTVMVSGQFRSYNKLSEERSRLMLTVFARSIEEPDYNINPNTIELSGYICKPPVYRTTPFKREICDILVAVNRSYGKSDYIPCIAWGRNARYVNTLSIGDKVEIFGRIQSREYQKTDAEGMLITKTAYEVSVTGLKTEIRPDSQRVPSSVKTTIA